VEGEERIIADALKKLGNGRNNCAEGKGHTRGHQSGPVEEQYHILHFIGHGTFEAEQGICKSTTRRAETI
jgi:hypothetical protein